MKLFSIKTDWSLWIFKVALFISFIYSMHPWFIWFLGNRVVILSVVLFGLTLFYSKYLYEVTRKKLAAFFIIILLYIYMFVCREDMTILGMIFSFLNILVFGFIIFSKDLYRTESLQFIAELLACISLFSMIGLILFLGGINFSPRMIDFNNGQYEYYNYYFFLIDLRAISLDKWRFSGCFLEPAHIGVASAVLLISQNYNLKKWYNVVLLLTIIISFSLAAYVLIFWGLYIKILMTSKYIIVYTFILLFVSISLALIAFNYNQGDNFVNKYIFERLVFKDGEMAGDNRVSHGFKKDYERFMESNKVWLGTKYDQNRYEGGNAGYRVYIYQNGLIGLLLIIMLYFLLIPPGTPASLALFLLILNAMIFWKGGTPLWYNLIIPYLFSFSSLRRFYIRSK